MRRGFTLIEMIVATMILALAVVAALAAFTSATRTTTYAQEIQTATILAQQQISQAETQPTSLSGGDQEGAFGENYPGYHWKQSVEATDYQNLFKVTVTVIWGLPQNPHSRSLTTYLRNDQNTQNPPSQNGTGTSSPTPGGG